MSRRSTIRASRRARVKFTASISPLLLAYDFSAASPGNLGTLSSSYAGLNLTRASAATVQTSASTVDSTPSTDQARVGSTGAAWGNGLVIEETRTNDLFGSRDLGNVNWAAGFNDVTTLDVGAGPDGGIVADRSNVTSAGFSRGNGVTETNGNTVVTSQWLRANSGTSSYAMACTPAHFFTGSVSTSWQRVISTPYVISGGVTTLYVTDPLDTSTAASDVWSDFHQVELGAFATEAIVTTTAAATRAGERVWVSSGASIISSNRMGLSFTIIGKGTPTQYGAIAYLWFIDASNKAWIDTSQKLNVMLGGTTVTSAAAISWSAGDVVDVWVACGAGANAVVEYRLNGGGAVTLINTALAGNPSGASTIDLLCSGTSNQLSCWLKNFSAYKTGLQPSWVV